MAEELNEHELNENELEQSNANQEKSENPESIVNSTMNDELKSLKIEWKTVTLPQITTLTQLTELHRQLQQYYGSRVQLCGSKVEQIDTAALQLLLAFINDPDITVGWMDYSPQLCTAAGLLGLSSHLGLPQITDQAINQ